MESERVSDTNHLDILGVKYALVWGTPTHGEQEALGYTDVTAPSITLNHNLVPSQQLYVALHEIIHALMFAGHFPFMHSDEPPHWHDEGRVDAVASLLAEVIKRNYTILKPMMEE